MCRSRSLQLLLCWALSGAASCQDTDPAPPVATSPSGSIAFTRGGSVFSLDVASGAETVLVADNDYDRPLVWLPRGDRLLYWNHDGGAWDLWAVDPESKARQNLTRTARDNRSPAGSPDGRSIAFHRGGDGLWLMDPDGGNQRQLSALGHRDAAPTWSPDSQRIAFTHLNSDHEAIVMTMHVVELAPDKAPRVRSLGQGEAGDFVDDTHFVAMAHHDGKSAIVLVDAATGERRPLTDSPGPNRNAVVSPDRSCLVWIAWHGERAWLKGMRSDGTDAHEIAPTDSLFAPPSFSPDGRWIAFESGPDRQSVQAHIVPFGGGDARRLTEKGGKWPVWRPTVKSR